jgi:phosphoribosylformylglycinamidine cyclo-ligase
MSRAAEASGEPIRAMAHITGGGWEGNVPRTLPSGLGAEIDTGTWPVPAIFSLIQARGDIADDEMVRLTAGGAPGSVDAVLAAVPDAVRVGRVVEVEPGAPRVRFG